MTELERLIAIEEIKGLKARYFRALDTQDWALMAEVLEPDIVADFRGATTDPETGFNPAPDATELVLNGAELVITGMAAGMKGVRSVHHGHMPEIEVVDADTATGVWAMYDSLRYPGSGGVREMTGSGHYHETYARRDGRWRIAALKLIRLRLEFLRADAPA